MLPQHMVEEVMAVRLKSQLCERTKSNVTHKNLVSTGGGGREGGGGGR